MHLSNASEVERLEELFDRFQQKRGTASFKWISLVSAYKQLQPYSNGGRIFSSLVDLRFNVTALEHELGRIGKIVNEQRQQRSSSLGSLLENEELFLERLALLEANTAYILRYRAISDKIMAILVLIFAPSEYDSFMGARTQRPTMDTLLIGFDSAWTATKCGAIVGVFCSGDGGLQPLGPPRSANYQEAEDVIIRWQAELRPMRTIVLLDQPTIVVNDTGQRPVENIVSSSVCRRYGGMQPASTGRTEMFGTGAPVWPFLKRFGGAADPLGPESVGSQVFETYPVLAMIALGWTLSDCRAAGRLPKYNPERRKTFSLSDWRYVCGQLSDRFRERGLKDIFQWLDEAGRDPAPRKSVQDGVDACFCLLVALCLVERADCLMVGDLQTGYIIVPDSVELRAELEVRCASTNRISSEWMRTFRLPPT